MGRKESEFWNKRIKQEHKRAIHLIITFTMIFSFYLLDSVIDDLEGILTYYPKDIIYALREVIYIILFSIAVAKVVKPEISVTMLYFLTILFIVLYLIFRGVIVV